MSATANPQFTNTYKELQAIVEQMVKDKAPLLPTIRDVLDVKMNSARNTSDELQKQITAITAELADTAARSGELKEQSQQRQVELATIRQRDASGSSDRENVEPEIRELRDHITRTEAIHRGPGLCSVSEARASMGLPRLLPRPETAFQR